MNGKNRWLYIFAGCVVAFACLTVLTVGAVVGGLYWVTGDDQPTREPDIVAIATATPSRIAPEPSQDDDQAATQNGGGLNAESEGAPPTLMHTAVPLTATPTSLPTLPPIPTAIAAVTPQNQRDFPVPSNLDQRFVTDEMRVSLIALLSTNFPARDYYETEDRLSNRKLRDRTVDATQYEMGQVRTINTVDGNVDIILVVQTDLFNYWVQEDLELDSGKLKPAAVRVEENYYPIVVDLFGYEWSPGVDNDPRINVIHLTDVASAELGYFDSSDEYPTEIFSHSNEMEAVYLNMGELEIGSEFYYGTLIHELQHLVHWNQDSNESTWIDEGLAQLAEYIAELDSFGVNDYLADPNMRVNSWPDSDDEVYAHYGAGALFTIYMWEQLGDQAIRDLVQNPADGMAAVAQTLNIHRPGTSLKEWVSDWYVANYLHNDGIDSRYDYRFRFAPPDADEIVRDAEFEETGEIAQYGVRYIDLAEPGQTTISFAGDGVIDLLPIPEKYGPLWFVPPIDSVAATLTRPFDLTAVEQATLKFDVWHELEQDYDFAYISVSDDGGTSWRIVSANSSAGGYYGPGFNGDSKGWVREAVSLNRFAGQEILLRFELLTDSAIVNRGFAIDNISIQEIGYQATGESDDGWISNGFVRAGGAIPQQWSVQLIQYGSNSEVIELQLDGFNQGEWVIDVADSATIVIAPITPFVDNNGRYWLNVSRSQ